MFQDNKAGFYKYTGWQNKNSFDFLEKKNNTLNDRLFLAWIFFLRRAEDIVSPIRWFIFISFDSHLAIFICIFSYFYFWLLIFLIMSPPRTRTVALCAESPTRLMLWIVPVPLSGA